MSLLLSQSGVFILGLCLGSFLNVVIYRLPKTDMSVSSPRRSLCPSCQAPISWYDNLRSSAMYSSEEMPGLRP